MAESKDQFQRLVLREVRLMAEEFPLESGQRRRLKADIDTMLKDL